MTEKDKTTPQPGHAEPAVRKDAAGAEGDRRAATAAPAAEALAETGGAGSPEPAASAAGEAPAADAGGPQAMSAGAAVPVEAAGPAEAAASAEVPVSAQARRSAPAWLAGVEAAEDSLPVEVQAKRARMAELAGQAEQLERAAKARLANRTRQPGARTPAPGFFGQPGASAAAAEEPAAGEGAGKPAAAEPAVVGPAAVEPASVAPEAAGPEAAGPAAAKGSPADASSPGRTAPEAPALSAPAPSAPASATPGGPFGPDGTAQPASAGPSGRRSARRSAGQPEPDAGKAAPQEAQGMAAGGPVPANAPGEPTTGTSALPVVAAEPAGTAVLPPTPTPPPVAASTPDPAEAARSAKRSGFGFPGSSSEPGADAQRRSEAREAALAAKPLLARILQTVLAIAYPFLVLIGAIKLVASPWFLWLEYNRPGFPADAYGFSAGERLTYGSYGVDYLNNAAGPEYLGNLTDPGGNPLFLNTEVAHMADVKAVVAVTFAAGLVLLAASVAIALYLSRRYAGGIRRALFAGAVSTVALMVVLAVAGTLNWRAFFSGFHSLFFAEGTWTFRLEDTLIRLYPTQFWVDSAIAVAALVLVASLVTLVLTWPTARRRERSRLRQEARDFGLGH
ncbi:hypothetical protein NCCP1664_23280 [Zafaria cholistanensis]|uniref:TIGR01906 family membrane protein n=1 Tax=Zafaria cholistanensis TaxID=1682741 RepID=A0A5A7NSS0_9MICC|nr:TIGR01906 family membrane protein [Zafaria cholistanensis]GER23833.1 hypothetical protein NCCP1664_23280 [Zafaria cholistanensis]